MNINYCKKENHKDLQLAYEFVYVFALRRAQDNEIAMRTMPFHG